MKDCVVRHLLLAPNQWKEVAGVRVENLSDKVKRVVVTVVTE
jgi:hypothetical protein